MAADVLNVLCLLGIDVARQVEIEVVPRDLVMWHKAGVAGMCFPIRKNIHDLVQVALAETVLVAVLHEAFGGTNHEDAFAASGVFLVEYKDARGDAGAVKQVGRKADDALEIAGADELGADHGLGIASK